MAPMRGVLHFRIGTRGIQYARKEKAASSSGALARMRNGGSHRAHSHIHDASGLGLGNIRQLAGCPHSFGEIGDFRGDHGALPLAEVPPVEQR